MRGSFQSVKVCAEVLMRFLGLCRCRFANSAIHSPGMCLRWRYGRVLVTLDISFFTEIYLRLVIVVVLGGVW